jgi:hypothetical protein
MQEAAVDADRVYLAAIDKFDAMLSKSNTYAPEGWTPLYFIYASEFSYDIEYDLSFSYLWLCMVL